MAGTAITTFYDYVDDYVNGASDETAILNRAIIATIRDFCRFTHLWKETLTAITTIADQDSYTLTAPTDNGDEVEISGLDEVQYKEDGAEDNQFFPLTLTSREFLDTYEKGWEHRTGPAPNTAFYDHLDGKIYLVPEPTLGSTTGLVVRTWLMPDYTATTVPAFLFSKYIYKLAEGIAGNMMRMTNQRWSDPELGDYYHNLYQSSRMNAQQDQDRGFADVENYRVIPEPAFTGRSKSNSRRGTF